MSVNLQAKALEQLQEMAQQLGYDRMTYDVGPQRWFLERDLPWNRNMVERVALDAFYGPMKAELVQMKIAGR